MTERGRVIATRVAIAAGVAAIVAVGCWQRWRVLGATPFPVGIDGYFYPIEVRAILEHGVLRYPASPVTFYWMAPFAVATDPIIGAKLGAAIGCALIAVPAYGVGARLGGLGGSPGERSIGAGLLAAVIAGTSAGSGFLAIEFVKQGIGLTVALGALWILLAALERPSRGRVIGAVVAVVVAIATHKMAAAIVVLVAGPALAIRVRGKYRGRRLLYAVIAVAVAVIGIVVLGAVAPQRFVSLHELGLLGELFTGDLRWDAPALVMEHSLVFDHEAAIGGIVAIGAAIVLVRGTDREVRASAWVIVGLGILIALPTLAVSDPQGLGFRLRVAAFVPLALNAAIVAGALPGARRELVVAICAAALLAIEAPRDRTEGEVLTHPALADAVVAARHRVPAGATVIVPERHILFMVDWYTRADVSLRPEPVPYARRVRLFGLVFIGGAGSPLDQALDEARAQPGIAPPIGLHAHYRNGLVLVTEPTWDWLLTQLPAPARAHFAAWPTI